MKGLIPCAGKGTRLHPLSLAVPKELLPVGVKPAVSFHVEDLSAAGIREIIVVINRAKSRIEDYLTHVFPQLEFRFVIQDDPGGLGFAILASRELIGNEPFLLLLPDNIFFGLEPLSVSLLREQKKTGKSCVALFRDGKFKPGARTGYELKPLPDGGRAVSAVHPVEALPPDKEVFFGPAAMLFTSEIFLHLESSAGDWDPSEGDYTERPALESLIHSGGVHPAWVEGECFDIGTVDGYKDCLKALFGPK